MPPCWETRPPRRSGRLWASRPNCRARPVSASAGRRENLGAFGARSQTGIRYGSMRTFLKPSAVSLATDQARARLRLGARQPLADFGGQSSTISQATVSFNAASRRRSTSGATIAGGGGGVRCARVGEDRAEAVKAARRKRFMGPSVAQPVPLPTARAPTTWAGKYPTVAKARSPAPPWPSNIPM